MLVWRGKIIEKLETKCQHGHFLCEFGCDVAGSFKIVVCAQLFVERKENDVSIPMEFSSEDRVYDPATENTPLSLLREFQEVEMVRMPEIQREANELITQDEIKRLKTNPRQLSWKDIVLGKGFAVPITPIELKSGYLISYSIDTIFDNQNIKLKHVMVGAEKFEPDPADMDIIAHSILGDCFRVPEEMGYPTDELHYIRFMGLDDKDIKKVREAGIMCGAAVIEIRK